jgi:hypothetical protein
MSEEYPEPDEERLRSWLRETRNSGWLFQPAKARRESPISENERLAVLAAVERQRREEEENRRRVEERCRLAVKQWKAAHPWVDDPGMCVTVPVARLSLPDWDL